jgi:hypothetical protein
MGKICPGGELLLPWCFPGLVKNKSIFANAPFSNPQNKLKSKGRLVFISIFSSGFDLSRHVYKFIQSERLKVMALILIFAFL